MERDRKVVLLGQFFTTNSIWLQPQVVEFIRASGCSVAYDPFAGAGDLLAAAEKTLGFRQLVGADIDRNLNWNFNDSLVSIPHVDHAIIITNPPYLSNYSAARKKIREPLKKYFNSTQYDDLYLLALDRMLEAQEFVVAIIPETFINSGYKTKNRLHSITVLESSPFQDTDAPVVVACFDGREKPFDEVKIYKNANYIYSLAALESLRLTPDHSVALQFNDPSGWMGVRCVDSTNPKEMLRFDFKENIPYDWENGIKVSSRLLTLIRIDVPEEKRQAFLDECNSILNRIRTETADLIFSPFKGNMTDGRRRRRLDFLTCRAIIETAYHTTVDGKKTEAEYEQLGVF